MRRLALAVFFALFSAFSGISAQGATASFAAGREAYDSGRWHDAIELFLQALSYNPSYLDPMLGLAEAYNRLEEYPQALSWIAKAKPLTRSSTALSLIEADAFVGSGRIQEAEAIYTGILAREPNRIEAQIGLAEIDISRGRQKSAETRYEAALRVSPDHERSLLALSVLRMELGDPAGAEEAIKRALRSHSGSPQVQFYASYVASRIGELDLASSRAEMALQLDPNYVDALRLLSTIKLDSGKPLEARDLASRLVRLNRMDERSWYLLGVAQLDAGASLDARRALTTANGLKPDDELIRVRLENLLIDELDLEDKAREPFADWRFTKAKELESRFLYDSAIAEYRRGLKLYPYSENGRRSYAELLIRQGLPARALSELLFLRSIGKANDRTKDLIEAYSTMLAFTPAKDWGIDQFALDKRRYSIMLFPAIGAESFQHPRASQSVSRYLAEMARQDGAVNATSPSSKPIGFAEAFRRAREAKADYFGLVSIEETDRDLKIGLRLFVARTGSIAAEWSVYRSGNDRLRSACQRLVAEIRGAMPLRGTLISRKGQKALADIGLIDGVKVGDTLSIVRTGIAEPLPEGVGLSFSQDEVLGYLKVTRLDEECLEGELTRSGFYDRVNVGDTILVAPKSAPTEEAKGDYPGLLRLIRSIRGGSFL